MVCRPTRKTSSDSSGKKEEKELALREAFVLGAFSRTQRSHSRTLNKSL